jgi:hypothetical protein
MYKIATGQDRKFGVPGYYLPKKSALYNSVSHAVPKEKGKSFIDYTARRAKLTPSPVKYDNARVSWKTARGKFMTQQKKTYIDYVKKKAKETPGPGQYKPMPVGFQKVRGGRLDKTKDVNIFTT